MRLARFLTSATLASLVVVACSDDDGPPPTVDISPETTTAASPAPESDGILTIGLLLPRGANTIGDPMIAAARTAVEEINTHEGEEFVTVVDAAEGANATEAESGIASLVAANVDAIVGPSSSNTTLGALDTIIDEGVLSCSPTASSMLLDDLPDRHPGSDEGLFFRSIPSDSLQAQAIAERTVGTGGQSVVITYLDDIYGRGLLDATREILAGLSITIDRDVAISPTDDALGDQAEAALESVPDAVIVLADNVEGPRMLAALDTALRRTASNDLPNVVVNDAVRRPASPEVISELRADFRERIQGVSPHATPPVEPPTGAPRLTGNFSVNAYNCVAAIALASRAADTDRPTDIAAQMEAVSINGDDCYSYRECADLADDDNNIDFGGPDRLFDLDEQGDVETASFDVFSFGENGVDATFSSEEVSS